MLNLIPFSKNDIDFMNCVDAFQRDWFKDLNTSVVPFKTDVIETKDGYTLRAELPGFDKEEIGIDIKDDTLTIHAEHKEESKEENSDKHYIRRECSTSSFKRSFNTEGIDKDNITASYKNGILELSLKKEAQKAPKSINISIA